VDPKSIPFGVFQGPTRTRTPFIWEGPVFRFPVKIPRGAAKVPTARFGYLVLVGISRMYQLAPDLFQPAATIKAPQYTNGINTK